MTFDHILALFKLGTLFVKKEKAPVVVAPSSSSIVFDSKDAAIFCLSIALIFAVFAVLNLSALAARR